MAYAQHKSTRWGLPEDAVRSLAGRKAVFIKEPVSGLRYSVVLSSRSHKFAIPDVQSKQNFFYWTWGQKSKQNRTFGPVLYAVKSAEYKQEVPL